MVIAPSAEPVSCPDVGPPPVAKTDQTEMAFAGYDGRWFLMEPDDDEVELVMEIHGTRGTIRDIGDEQSQPMRIERRPNGMALIVIPDPGGDSEKGFLVPRGPHSLTAFRFGQDEAMVGRREGKVPSWFRGEWELSSLRGRGPFLLAFDGKQGRMVRDGKARKLDIRAMRREGPVFELVVQRTGTRREEDVAWLRIQEVEPGVYLVFEGQEEDFVVMYRPGAIPSWVEQAQRKGSSPPSPKLSPPPRVPTPVKPPLPPPTRAP